MVVAAAAARHHGASAARPAQDTVFCRRAELVPRPSLEPKEKRIMSEATVTIKAPKDLAAYQYEIPISKPLTKEQRDNARLGIELPFDWCLVRGRELRRLQMQLHEAEQTAALRLRIIANQIKEQKRKESR
jgi:hypothetical protein